MNICEHKNFNSNSPDCDFNSNSNNNNNNNNNNNLRLFNKICKETNVIYHNYASSKGVSDTTFWILYSICYYGEGITQTDICEEWFYSAQTINSALKSMEQKGLITLKLAPESKKSKQIFFTDTGRSLAEELVLPVIKAEEQSFTGLDKKELETMFDVSFKHLGQLENLITNL